MDMLHGAELISTIIKALQKRRNEECFKNHLKKVADFPRKLVLNLFLKCQVQGAER